MNVTSQRIRLSLFLMPLLFVLAAVSVRAQEEALVYQDPDGRFSAVIPSGWTDESTAEYGLFTKDGVAIYLLAVEADDVQNGIDAALQIIDPELEAEPAQSAELPAPNGIWTQNVYLLDGGALAVVFGQVRGGVTYVMAAHAPDQAAVQAATNDLNNVVLGFTIGEVIDLTGVVPVPFDDAMLADLEAYVTGAMERFEIPGAAVAVVQGDETVYANGFGVLEVGSDQPVTADTLFMVGSTNKSMTTMMMATLVDEGILDWDTPVVDILPTFALSNPDAAPEIRVRDLVNMSSGVARFDAPMFLAALPADQMIESLADIPLVAQPGEQFNYSNQMVASGGFIAALAAGGEYGSGLADTYAELIQARVFDPIGMTSTTLDFDAAIARDNVASPHNRDFETGQIVPVPLDFERFVISVAPAGAAWSTMEDMARYVGTHLNQGVAPDGTRIVSAENLEATHTLEVGIAGPIGYGMGWVVEEYKGLKLVWHNGGTVGFTTDMAFLPDAGIAVVVVNNRGQSDSFNLAVREYVFELAFALLHEADARYMAAAASFQAYGEQLISSVRFEPVDPDTAADYLGQYEQGIEVTLNGDQLTLVTAFGEVPLYPMGDDAGTFITGGGVAGLSVAFTQGEGTMTVAVTVPTNPAAPFVLAKVE
jgi:CubicO group peptidase (beta-lactamase class C family)